MCVVGRRLEVWREGWESTVGDHEQGEMMDLRNYTLPWMGRGWSNKTLRWECRVVIISVGMLIEK